MRRSAVLPLLVSALLAALPGGAQTPKEAPKEAVKDTQAAAATRRRLKEKISIDMKNEMLRDVMKEIVGELEGAKKGRLSYHPDTGVSLNSRLTIKAKDKPVEEILDEMFKPLDLGYVIVNHAGDGQDGHIMIKKGNQRGDETAPDSKEKKKDEPKAKEKKEMPKEAKTAPADDDKEAARMLSNAKTYVGFKKPEKAKEILKDLLEKYPGSKQVEEAKAMLEKLEKDK